MVIDYPLMRFDKRNKCALQRDGFELLQHDKRSRRVLTAGQEL